MEIVRKLIDESFDQVANSSIDHWNNAFDNVLKAEKAYEAMDEQFENEDDIDNLQELTDTDSEQSD